MKQMFHLSQTFLNQPVMSLRAGNQVGQTLEAIINPNNLKVEGFFCQDSFNRKQKLILLSQDIRDILPQGIAVNDHEVLSQPDELVRLKDIIKLNFSLIGKPVVTVSKKRLGKVSDYAVEVETMYIGKIYIAQSLVKSFSGGGLAIDRDQITEITNKKIVVQDPLQGVEDGETQTAPVPLSPAT